MAGSTFTSTTLRNWMFRGVDGSRTNVEDVSLIGHNPFEQDDFERFLSRRKIDTWEPAAYTEVLVLGREGWQGSDLERLLRKRAGETLRVYSHEMFLAYLISGNDPLETPRVALQMGKGHPGLEYLTKVGFEWPSIAVKGFGRSRSFAADWRPESFLKAKGYRVGDGAGNHPQLRRRALERAYAGRIPARFGAEYAADCGSPNSTLRLRRMAYAIAKAYHLGAGRLGSNSTACIQWSRDLKWLKRRYYEQHPQFEWPSVAVGD